MVNLIQRVAGFFARFRDDQGAAITLELAFAVPVLATLLMSGVDLTRYVLINQKLERTAATMGDLISRMPELTEGDITSLFGASDQTMIPYDLRAEGHVIISSIAPVSGTAEVVWQRDHGLVPAASRYGDSGNPAVLPAGFVVRDNENVITAEVFYDFKPILLTGVMNAQRLYSSALFRPRFGNLTSVLP